MVRLLCCTALHCTGVFHWRSPTAPIINKSCRKMNDSLTLASSNDAYTHRTHRLHTVHTRTHTWYTRDTLGHAPHIWPLSSDTQNGTSCSFFKKQKNPRKNPKKNQPQLLNRNSHEVNYRTIAHTGYTPATHTQVTRLNTHTHTH